MVSYLLKVTLIWSILLLVFELLYRKNTAFTLTRIYLFLALVAGLVLPWITWSILPWTIPATSGITAIANGVQRADALAINPVHQSGPEAITIPWQQIALWLYFAGAAIIAVISIRGILLIMRKAIYGQHRTINGHRIFSSAHPHAPFSFMGWIFISNPEQYSDTELHYILRHEDGHNSRKHWLDIILMQLVFVMFWFHPLVWRFRYLLRLTHEYEADRIAARSGTYEYGCFLLQQTLLKGTPAMAHSFHYSPIKKRITMLTTEKKTNTWKFAFVFPILLGCTMLFASTTTNSQRVRVGDVTTYKGHQFFWQQEATDSMQAADPVSGEIKFFAMPKPVQIWKMDQDSVFSNEDGMITAAQFRHNNQNFYEYVSERFLKTYSGFPDTIRSIGVMNMVIDERGKLMYYDLRCFTDRNSYDISLPDSPYGHYGRLLTKIIDESPEWLPAIRSGKKIKVTPNGGFNVYFLPMTGIRVMPPRSK